jgi:hypothetical protein
VCTFADERDRWCAFCYDCGTRHVQIGGMWRPDPPTKRRVS